MLMGYGVLINGDSDFDSCDSDKVVMSLWFHVRFTYNLYDRMMAQHYAPKNLKKREG